MARSTTPHPTGSELAILQVLWKKGTLTVREVHDEISAETGVSYTTVLKTMQIMLEKGLVQRDAAQRSHLYSAAVTQQSTQSRILRHVLDAAFEGSFTKLFIGALRSKAATARELKEIQKLIEEQE